MAYLGQSNSLYDPTRVTPTTVQTFNGDGITTQFNLQYSVLQSIDIEVLVENVFQQPDYAYTAIGNVVTFTSAPPPGTNNIYVRFGKVTGLTGTVPDGSVTSSKLANNIRLLATDMYTGTGSQTAFNLSDTPADANSLIVTVNGVGQAAPSNYTVSGSTITFTAAPSSGANVVIRNVGFRTTQTLFAFPSGTQMVQPVITGGNISNATLANTSFTGSFAQSNAINGYDAFSATRAGRTFSWGLDVSGNYGIWDTTTSVNNRLLIDSSGNVGIGTSSPANKLHVSGDGSASLFKVQATNTNGTASINLVPNGTGNGQIYTETGALLFSPANTERARIDASGRLLVNNTYSSGALGSIVSYGGDTVYSLVLRSPNYGIRAFSEAGAGGFWFQAVDGTGSVSYQPLLLAGGGVRFWSGTAGGGSISEAARIDSSGNLLVGTTSATSLGGVSWKTVISGTANVLAVANPGTGGATTAAFQASNFSGSGVNVINFYNGSGTFAGSISIPSNGSTGTTTAYNTSSDQRLKENIVDAPIALSSVKAIKVRSFDWRSDGSHVDYGYIAQELLEVVPEAVHVPADPEEMMGVDFGKLTPRLVKAIQELSAKVDSLQSELTQLKSSK